MAKRLCEGTGKPAAEHPEDEWRCIYPFCPACDREFSAAGRNGDRRYGDVRAPVPRHFVTMEPAS